MQVGKGGSLGRGLPSAVSILQAGEGMVSCDVSEPSGTFILAPSLLPPPLSPQGAQAYPTFSQTPLNPLCPPQVLLVLRV